MARLSITRIEPRSDIRLGIISPDGRDAMLAHAQQFHAAGIPFVSDADLASLVSSERQQGRLRNDDVTLVAIEIADA